MARSVVKARKIGGSLMITIPRDVVELEDIRAGDMVEVEIRKARKSGFGITPEIGHFTHEDELDTRL
jgi:antitoxin component of MazEF toxin-antitoxin module